MKQILKIDLKSDLMPGSGIGFGAGIDADICYDDMGLPYIPGKRIKGSLRRAGEEAHALGDPNCSENVMAALFGTEKLPGALQVRSARLEGYREKRQKCAHERLPASLVADKYTSLRRQTSIDEWGAARPESLRTIRVIRKNLSFVAEVELLQRNPPPTKEAEDSTDKDTITDEQLKSCLDSCVNNFYSLGMMSNRGLGHIKASWTPANQDDKNKIMAKSSMKGGENTLVVVFRLDSPVIASNRYGQETDRQIPGSTMRGCMLAAWSRFKGYSGTFFKEGDRDYQQFTDIFLSGTVHFGDALITDEEGNAYHPLPANILAIKDVKDTYTDSAVKTPEIQTKSLKHYYVQGLDGQQPQTMKYLKVSTSTAYHMSTKDDRALFQYSGLKEGQCFRGEIHGPSEKLLELYQALEAHPDLSIGRSRTAQYGAARVERLSLMKFDWKPVSDQNGLFLAILLSPAWLLDDFGMSVCNAPAFLEGLRQALGDQKSIDESQILVLESVFLRVCHLGGYNPAWRLAKQSAHCLDIGSSLLFRVKDSDGQIKNVSLPPRIHIGENPTEGLGEVLLIPYSERTESITLESALAEDMSKYPDKPMDGLKAFSASQPKDLAHAAIFCHAAKHPIQSALNNSTIQSLIKALDNAKTSTDFLEMIKNIKDENKREQVVSALFDVNFPVEENEFLSRMELPMKRIITMLSTEIKSLKGGGILEWEMIRKWQSARLNRLKLAQRGKR